MAAAAPPNTLESQGKRARLTASTVTAGGGNAPVALAPEVAPTLAPSADGDDTPGPDGEGKEQASSAEEAKSLRQL